MPTGFASGIQRSLAAFLVALLVMPPGEALPHLLNVPAPFPGPARSLDVGATLRLFRLSRNPCLLTRRAPKNCGRNPR